ncbi:MAG: 16S rRNA (cytosine(1402)-N(4))-methyltransferase RsmH [Paludibacteraceae bacterium]
MNNTVYHIPALLAETIAGLRIQPDGTYVDVTFGSGGHSRAIMEHLGANGKLYSFDQDMDAYANTQTLAKDSRWQFVHSNFRYLRNFMDFYGVQHIDGLIADLGVSFHHFDTPERGFSFRFVGPLDMRMNQSGKRTAADIINTYTEENLARVLYLYGEMRNARQVAKSIIQARDKNPITRTEQLVQLVTHNRAKIGAEEIEVPINLKKDMARLFQALRIEVNDEMGALREMLVAARDLLCPGGRIAILTYHSLEDRIVKNFFRAGNLEGNIEKDFYGNVLTPFRLIEKGRSASEEEVERNPRSRSAKLRVAEKL